MGKKTPTDTQRHRRLDSALADEIANYLFTMGAKFYDANNAEVAFDCFKYSLDLNPKNQPAAHNLAHIYSRTGDLPSARRMFKEAVRMCPTSFEGRLSLANVERRLGELDVARAILTQINAESPNDARLLLEMSVLEHDDANILLADDHNEAVLKLEPKNPHALLNKVLLSMEQGRWAENWSGYEEALSYGASKWMLGLKRDDSWDGTTRPGKSLIVVSDQGSGDAIQFARYLMRAKEVGQFASVVYLVQPDTVDLLRRSGVADQVLPRDAAAVAAMRTAKAAGSSTVFTSLLGVCRALQLTPQNCFMKPNLVLDDAMLEVWWCRINDLWDGKSKKVGLVWSGDPAHGNDHNRSLTFAQATRLMNIPGVQIFSLQVGVAAEKLKILRADSSVVDLGSYVRNWDDTAHALANLDVLVTVDTAAAHLAGCLGTSAHVLLPMPSEWRWLQHGTMPTWYIEDMSLWRQKTPGNWAEVVSQLIAYLQTWATI
jgi:hypothetical protein